MNLTDGTLELLPLADFSGLPGWAIATLLPADYGVIELWVGGEVVADI